jgi:hypothetical protein
MPNLARYPRGFGNRKPGPWARVDGSHPLARNLTGAWVLNEQGGSPRDLLTGKIGSLTSGMTWAPTTLGMGLKAAGTSDRFDTLALSSLTYAAGTVAWAMTPGFSPTDGNQYYLWGEDSSSGVNAATPEISAQKFTDNNLYIGWNTSADTRIVVSAATNLLQGVLQHYAFVWSASGCTLYRNGVSIGTTSAPTVQAVAHTFCWLHTSTNVTGQAGCGNNTTITYGYIWNRSLLSAEVHQLWQQPYAILQQAPPRRAFFGPSSSSFTWQQLTAEHPLP